jgi:hypothetical protein
MLILTAVWAISVWTESGEAIMDKHAWIALGLGTFFSLLIGCGLMALMFFSGRSGHDEVAESLPAKARAVRLGCHIALDEPRSSPAMNRVPNLSQNATVVASLPRASSASRSTSAVLKA